MPLQMVLGERTWQLYPPGGKLGRNQGLSITIPNQTVSGSTRSLPGTTPPNSGGFVRCGPTTQFYLNGQELPQARQPLPSDGELIFGNVTVRFSYEAVGTRQKDSTPPTLGPIPIKPDFSGRLPGRSCAELRARRLPSRLLRYSTQAQLPDSIFCSTRQPSCARRRSPHPASRRSRRALLPRS